MATKSQMGISKDSNKYLISLDALDLSLLPISYTPRFNDSTVLLWNRNNFSVGTQNNFELEIKSICQSPLREFDGTVDDASTNSSTNTICHICNTYVPNAYFPEHLRSSKHTSFQKIADTAIERIRKHKQVIGKDKKSELEYFCAHCVSAIALSNRNYHEKTKMHKNMAALDSFLDNFASFYTNTDENEDANSEMLQSADANIVSLEVNRKLNEESDQDLDVDFEVMTLKINNNKIHDFRKDLIKDGSEFVDDTKSVSVKEKEITVHDSKIKDDLLQLRDRDRNIEVCLDGKKEMNNNLTEVNDDNNVETNFAMNLSEYIRLLKRHSTIKMNSLNSNDQDRVLVETLDGAELVISLNDFHGFKTNGNKYLQCKLCKIFISDENEHKVSKKHLNFVAQPFKDKHCMRHLIFCWSHCVLCNEITDDATAHKQFDEHNRNVEQALVSVKVTNTPTIIKINEPYPEIISNNDIIIKDINIPKSVNTVSDIIRQNSNVNSFNEPETKDFSPDLKFGNTGSAQDWRHFCESCNKVIHVNDVALHLRGTKHIINSKTVNNYLMRKDTDGLKCNVCQTNVPISFWAIEDHVSSVDHVIHYFNTLATNKIDKIEDNLYCKPCAETLVKTSEIVHIEKESHKIKLASYNRLGKLCMDGKSGKDSEKSADEISAFNNNYAYKVDTKSVNNDSDVCKDSPTKEINSTSPNDCDTNDTNGIVSTDDGDAKAIKIQQNTDDSPTCQREAHDVDFLNSDGIKIHNEGTNQELIDELISDVSNSLEELGKYIANPSQIYSHLQRMDNENEFKCKICTDTIPIGDANKHMNSLKHINNYKHLVDDNKLKLKEKRYVCQACNVYVENYKEFIHIESEKHAKRVESLRSGHFVLVTADARKIIDTIDDDLQFLEHETDSNAKGLEFGDFVAWKMKGMSCSSNVNHHYVKLIDDRYKLFCILCHVVVLNSDNGVTTHANDRNHIMKHKDLMNHNQIFEIDAGFVCSYCDCVLDNEFLHISGGRHRECRKKYRQKNFCFKCNCSTVDVGVREHVTSIQHVRNLNREVPAFFYCNVCDLQLSNNEMSVRRHIDTFQHRSNCSLMEDNKVFMRNRRCFCTVCESQFNREFFELHISSMSHTMLLGGD